MTLRAARILSSETDNTIKQEQNTNVNINIKPTKQPRANSIPLYPNVQPFCEANIPKGLNQNVNFTPASPQMGFQEVSQSEVHHVNGTVSDSQMNPESAFQYQPPISNPSQFVQDRGIADLGNELDELDKKNRFLEMLVEMYENNPLKVNSYVVCESRLLMDMIKLLTDCEKVDLVLDEDISCGGCGGKPDKIIYVSKILITKDGKSEDLKYCRNDIYSQFIKYGVSMKMTC